MAGSAARLEDSCGSKTGSGGGGGARGGLGVPRRLPTFLGGSGIGAEGGEYCVPASTVGFFVEEVDRDLLWEFEVTVGD